MILQKQPNNWSCLPTAFAMALDIPLEQIILQIGHDGSEIKYPALTEPECRRAFSPHDLVSICLDLNYACIPVMKEYALDINEEIVITRTNEFMDDLYRKYQGVMCGVTKKGIRHAVAWDRNMIFDPVGVKYFKEDFSVEVFFIVTRFGGVG